MDKIEKSNNKINKTCSLHGNGQRTDIRRKEDIVLSIALKND